MALPACVIVPPTTRLAVPSPMASFRDRREAFLRLRPEGMDVTQVIHFDRMFGRHERFIGELRLMDGTVVADPETLLSAVDPGSATESSVMRYQSARRGAHRALWISRGLGLAAIGMFAASFAFDSDQRRAPFLTSGGLALGWVGARFAWRRATRRREAAIDDAYHRYDADLATHLHLCVDGDAVSNCP